MSSQIKPTDTASPAPAQANAPTPAATYASSEIASLHHLAAMKTRRLGGGTDRLRLGARDFQVQVPSGPFAQVYDEGPGPDERIARLLKDCGVPYHFRSAVFGALQQVPVDERDEYRRVLHVLADWFYPSNKPRLLLLGGGYGVGKSYTTAAMVLALCKNGHYAMWYDGRDFVNHARAMATSSYTDINWAKWVDRYRRMRLLVIDEVLAGCNTPFAQERIEEVVNARYAEGRDTILTANSIDTEAFRAVLGNRVIDRAMDGGGLLVWKGRSLRGRLVDAPAQPSGVDAGERNAPKAPPTPPAPPKRGSGPAKPLQDGQPQGE